VDEFQDISIGRYKLLEAIRKQNPAVKIMGVGDDWQSIYRFAGSDIALFKDFEDYFGFTERTRIETTYRFHEPMISLSSDFVQRNPNQTPKALRGTGEKGITNIKLITSHTADDTEALDKVLQSLLNSGVDVNRETCKVISRYSHDIDRIGPENKRFRIDKDRNLIFYKYVHRGETKEIVLDFLTIHKAKGLEADHVILLNANEGQYGFPAEMTDDPLLNLVLSDADQYENGEERRLFYVALTRARKNSYIISNRTTRSKFIHEIEPGLVHETAVDENKCPECRTGIIVQRTQGVARNGRHYRFFGCTNYSYGCTYSRQEWD
jgi:DNA helicase-4